MFFASGALHSLAKGQVDSLHYGRLNVAREPVSLLHLR